MDLIRTSLLSSASLVGLITAGAVVNPLIGPTFDTTAITFDTAAVTWDSF